MLAPFHLRIVAMGSDSTGMEYFYICRKFYWTSNIGSTVMQEGSRGPHGACHRLFHPDRDLGVHLVLNLILYFFHTVVRRSLLMQMFHYMWNKIQTLFGA